MTLEETPETLAALEREKRDLSECCGVMLAKDERFCPKCGWEARVLAALTPAEKVVPRG